MVTANIRDEPGVDPVLAAGALERIRARLFQTGETKAVALGRYVILERIGSGAGGVVYSAYDPQLERRVALKVLQPDGEGDEDQLRHELLAEARALARLTHPNVVPIYDAQESDGSGSIGLRSVRSVFVVMELVDGESLRQWLRIRRPWRVTWDVFRAAGLGLAAAHRAGLLHRDFKPDNVIIGADGRARVVDFGLAQALPRAAEPASGSHDDLEGSSNRAGTPAYMPPEQQRGEALDARSDQYAFCVALWEGLYGSRPFAGTTDEELLSAKSNRPTPPADSGVPRRFGRALAQGLSPSRSDRHPSMDALLASLGRDHRRLVRSAVAFLALFALLVGIGIRWYASQAQARRQCQAAADQTELWNPEIRASIGRAFRGASPDSGEETWLRATPRIDAFVHAWSDTRATSCERTLLEHSQGDAALAGQVGCLDQQLVEFTELLRIFSIPDEMVVGRATYLSTTLPDPTSCLEAPAVNEGSDSPPSLRDGEAMARRARVLRLAGRRDEAVELAGQVLQLAHDENLPSLASRAHRVLGANAHEVGETSKSIRHFRDAELAGEKAGDDGLVIDALNGLAEAFESQGNYEAAAYVVERNRAKIARRGKSALDQEVVLAVTDASVRASRGKEQEAISTLVEMAERVAAAPDTVTPIDRILLHTRLSEILNQVGSPSRAVDHMARADSIARETFGDGHSLARTTAYNLGTMLYDAGRFQDALTNLERSRDPGQPESAHNRALRARLLASLGRPSEAVAAARDALRNGSSEAASPLAISYYRTALTVALRSDNQFQEALRHAEAADAALASAPGGEPFRYETLIQLAAASHDVGAFGKSDATLDEARKLTPESAPWRRARIELAAANLAWSRDDKERAREALEQAVRWLGETEDTERLRCARNGLEALAQVSPPPCWGLTLEPARPSSPGHDSPDLRK